MALHFRGFPLNNNIILISFIILFLFISIEILLLIFSRNIKSKSLKTSIILRLLFWILGLIFLIGSLFDIVGEGVLLDFGASSLGFLIYFPIIILISIGFSIYSIIKVQQKKIAISNLVINVVYCILWLFCIRNVGSAV